MKEEVDLSKYDDKCYLILDKYKITIYHLMMEKDWWNNTPYHPILLIYTCSAFKDCISRQKRIATKEDLPKYNSNVKEISNEKFNEIRDQIEKFYVKEVQLKADKVRLCLQCEALW